MSEPPIVPSGEGSPTGSTSLASPPDPRYPPYTQYPPYLPYPPYPQPGYPPPGYWPPGYQMPGYPPPKKDNTRMVYGIIAAVLVVGIVLCVGCGLALSSYDNLVSHSLSGSLASLTVDELCLDEEMQDYSSAYTLLSSNLQQQLSESQFTTDGQQHDSTLGQISTCTQQGPAVSSSSTEVTATLAITRSVTPTPDASGNAPAPQASDYTGQVILVEVSSQWKVDQVDSALNML
jgi:hypothetical protein